MEELGIVLDLFCCAGGAAKGYRDAGYRVVGVDIAPQKNYPYAFVQADALKLLRALIDGYAVWTERGIPGTLRLSDIIAIHASPPCQGYSKMSNCRPGLVDKYPKLIEPTRELLIESGLPYVIENVSGSPLKDPAVLCGTMFGRELYRHRLFETSFPLHAPHMQPGCTDDFPPHPECGWPHVMPASKAGHWRPGTVMSVAGHVSPMWKARQIMEIGWTNRDELVESIPPYYSQYVGRALTAHLLTEMGI